MQKDSLWLEGIGTLQELKEILIGLKEVSEDWGKTRLGISSGVKVQDLRQM